METKDLLGLIILVVGILGCTLVTSLSQRARDVAFFFLAGGTGFAERLSVNFASHYWYRGTSRGFEFSFVDILAISLLISSTLFPRYRNARPFWPMSLAPIILYFFYGCFSVAISDPKLYGLFELLKEIRGLIVILAAAWYVRTDKELRILVVALGCSMCVEGLLAVKQRYLGGIYRSAGTLDHANSFSMYLCVVGPVLAAAAATNWPRWLRRFSWGSAAVATLSSLLTVSRAGIPIFFLILFGTIFFTVSFRFTAKNLVWAACVLAGLLGLFASQWKNLETRFEVERSLEEEYLDERSEGRGHYFLLAKAIVDDQFLGIGLNNWSYWVCKKYGGERGWSYQNYDDLDYIPPKEALSDYLYAPPAHSLGALTVGELGWPGLFVFSLIWIRWFWVGAKFLRHRSPEGFNRLGAGFFFSILGVFLQSQTEWVYRQASIFFTFHILLGALASLYYQRRNLQRIEKWRSPELNDDEIVCDQESAAVLAR